MSLPLNEVIEDLSDPLEIYAIILDSLKSRAVAQLTTRADYISKFLQSYDLSRTHRDQCCDLDDNRFPNRIQQDLCEEWNKIIDNVMDEFLDLVAAKDLPDSDSMLNLLLNELERMSQDQFLKLQGVKRSDYDEDTVVADDDMERMVDWVLNEDANDQASPDLLIEATEFEMLDESCFYEVLDQTEHLYYDQDFDQELLFEDINRFVTQQMLSDLLDDGNIGDDHDIADWQPSSASGYSPQDPVFDYKWQHSSDAVSWSMQDDPTFSNDIWETIPPSLDSTYDMIIPTSFNTYEVAEDCTPKLVSFGDCHDNISETSTCEYIHSTMESS